MTDKTKAEAFVKMPRDLIASDAWRALNINARRFLDFLMIEHMRHGGKENGKLLAPRRQIQRFGIGARFVSGAIEEAERLGFVDCKRGVGRQPSLYALTWLPLANGTQPTKRYLRCDAAAQDIVDARKASKRRKTLNNHQFMTSLCAVAT
jgi:hypothetical protein